ncbi:DNA-3-methyladenine glycosylase 2 family protein [Aeromicrobium sp.]|nr:DNA-3-methyladenine glycosylase 2 family protein [Candidatus Saccharibacteria bacterium]
MNPIASDTSILDAVAYLSQQDPIIAEVISQRVLCTIRPNKNYYQELVDGIISQQLSVHAARAIENRFRDLFGGTFPEPADILTSDVETLRGIGFSRAKASYVLDLAQHIVDGSVRFDHLDALTNEAVIAELIKVKGIGEWTVHMFLMFCMGRLDVLPVGDLGIRNGIAKLYDLPTVPKPAEVSELALLRGWHPYESVASWYIWQSLDNTPTL